MSMVHFRCSSCDGGIGMPLTESRMPNIRRCSHCNQVSFLIPDGPHQFTRQYFERKKRRGRQIVAFADCPYCSTWQVIVRKTPAFPIQLHCSATGCGNLFKLTELSFKPHKEGFTELKLPLEAYPDVYGSMSAPRAQVKVWYRSYAGTQKLIALRRWAAKTRRPTPTRHLAALEEQMIDEMEQIYSPKSSAPSPSLPSLRPDGRDYSEENYRVLVDYAD